MRLPSTLGVLLLAALCTGLRAQPELFGDGVVHRVEIRFAETRWRAVLDSLKQLGENERLLGDMWIDGLHYADVGVRYKGYSSYAPGRAKNPFNIKLDEVHGGQHHQGHRKLRLSNVSYDPSFLREVLSYDVARCYMPASLANFTEVYVNDTLVGLYTNVEEVGKDFVERHFGSRSNSFFKGNPPTVQLTGENCNLSDAPGSDSAAYYGLYGIESDHGWGHLLELIDVLNNEPQRVGEVLNVDRALWMHALNYALINFDSYVGYAQNFYLYRDDAGLWNTIPWDLNMSFASFRLTDASLYWNGFSIAQAITMDPLMHHNSISVFPRPLMRNLFDNPMYRRMYLAHLRTIIHEWFSSGLYHERALQWRALITPHVLADTNKFFTDQQYFDNLELQVTGITDYPGIAQLMDARSVWLEGYPGFTGEPVIGVPEHQPGTITVGGDFHITVAVEGADSVLLAYRFGPREAFRHEGMHDDGLHADGAAGDGVFGARINAGTNLVEYYIYAENDTAGAFSPERAAHEYHRVQTRILPGQLVINELMAYNTGPQLNELGEAADWIELYNPGPFTVSTVGLHLSDDPLNVQKWPLPQRILAPGQYMVIWADERGNLGEEHANFKLSASGETLTLAYDADAVVDQVNFGPQYPVSSVGRYPNGTGAFRELLPTFGTQNRYEVNTSVDSRLLLYPVPATTELFVVVREEAPLEVQLFASDGRAITAVAEKPTRDLLRIPTLGLSSGVYIIRVRTASGQLQSSFIITP